MDTGILSRIGFKAQPLFWLALAAVLGITLAEISEVPLRVAITLAVLGSALLFAWPRAISVWIFIGTVFLLNAVIHQHRTRQLPQYDRLLDGGGLPVTITGKIDQLVPSRETPAGGFSTTLRLSKIETARSSYQCRLRVRLLGSREKLRPSFGDVVQVSGYLQLPKQARNPGEFNARVHLKSRGATAEIRADRENDEVLILGNDGAAPLKAAMRARAWIASTITRDLEDEPQTTALLQAMFLGAKEEASSAMIDKFRYSGALHVFAVSGLHVGLVGLILWAVLTPLRLPRRAIIVAVGILLISYTFITGLRPSAVRATTMAIVVLGGLLLDRQPRLLNSLGAAALLLLAWEPFRLLDLGFQLSFGVLLAIALLVPFFRRLLQPWCSPDPFLPRQLLTDSQERHFRHRVQLADIAAVSLAAWIGSTPLNLIHFSLVTPIALIANPLVLLLTSAILFGCILSGILALTPWTAFLSLLVNNANHFLSGIVLALVGALAEVPGGHHQVAVPEWPPWQKKLKVEVLDLPPGGSAQLLQVPGENGWLIDSGDENTFRSTTFAFLKTRGLLELDGVVLTHTDMRHSGGVEQLVNTLDVGRELGPPKAEERAELPERTRGGDVIDLSDRKGTLTVLFPPDGELANKTDDRAMVLLLVWEGWRILFKSDSGFITEKYLLEHHREDIRADVIVTGRHNSDYTLLEEFVRAVGPRAVIATDAPFPPEQRIPNETRTTLRSLGIDLFESSRTGAVRIRATKKKMTLKGYLDGRAEYRR